MEPQRFDRSSKWLLEHEGRGLLALVGIRDVVSCRAVQPEVVQPRSLPDGLLEARIAGSKKPVLFLFEISTYPAASVAEQVCDDLQLTMQARRVLPETYVLVLHPRGKAVVPQTYTITSPQGTTACTLAWKVVELWTLAAEELLLQGDVGLIPWVPLTQFTGAPGPILQRCRERIDREGGQHRANLLAVTQVFTTLRFLHPGLLDILGGSRAMIESPLMQRFEAEVEQRTAQNFIQKILLDRFTTLPPCIEASLRLVKAGDQLERLLLLSYSCRDLEAFDQELQQLLAPPEPSTRRRKRKN